MSKTIFSSSISIILLLASTLASGAGHKQNSSSPKFWQPNTITGKQCIQLPDKNHEFGQITYSDFEQWVHLEKLLFVSNTQSLATGHAESGEPYLRQRLRPTKKGSTRVTASGKLPPATTYRLSQSIFLEQGFDWGGKNEGGKIGFGLGGNTAPTGGMLNKDGFSARIMWRGKRDGTARFSLYAYSSDRSQNLPYGDDHIIEDYSIPIGEWVDVAMEVTVNSNVMTSDGSVRVWINNELKLRRKNIRWQAEGPEPAVDRLLYTTFYGGGDTSWSPSSTVFIRTSSICWQR